MSITVRLPALLRECVDQNRDIEVKAAKTLKDLLGELGKTNEKMEARIFDRSGNIQPYLNVFINNAQADSLGGLDVQLKDGDEVYIISSIAGG